MTRCRRVAIFLISTIAIFMTMFVAVDFVSTLGCLDVIEADRDRGDNAGSHLPVRQADAVLTCKTYHEFADPQRMLRHFQDNAQRSAFHPGPE